MSDDFKLQVSIKVGNDMVNVRADSVAELQGSLTQYLGADVASAVAAKFAAPYGGAPQPTPEQAQATVQQQFQGTEVVPDPTTPAPAPPTPVTPPTAPSSPEKQTTGDWGFCDICGAKKAWVDGGTRKDGTTYNGFPGCPNFKSHPRK